MDADLPGGGLDRELALSRVGGDAELLKEIAALFLEDYPKVLGEIRAAAARGDAQGMSRAAHGLKGSVANFGARTAVAAALALEQVGRDGDLAGARESLEKLERALAELRVELQAL